MRTIQSKDFYSRIQNEEGRIEARAAERASASKSPEEYERVRQVIESIDLVTLTNIHGEIARRAGVNHDDLNVITREKIFIVIHDDPSLDDSGSKRNSPWVTDTSCYDQTSDTLLFVGEGGESAGELLHSFFHETTHLMGANRTTHIETVPSSVVDVVHVSGLVRTHQVYKASNEQYPYTNTVYDLFNEGLTETIAERVGSEYIRRTPLQINGVAVKGEDLATLGDEAYKIARLFVERFVEHIARLSEVPQDVVWNGLFRAYYQGEPVPAELLDELVGHEFSEKLANVIDKHTLRELARSYDFPPIHRAYLQRLLAFLSDRISPNGLVSRRLHGMTEEIQDSSYKKYREVERRMQEDA